MDKNPIEDILKDSMENLRNLVDVNTIIGTPITPVEGITIIPISKVTFGFGSGGMSNMPSEKAKNGFGFGSAGGVTIIPLSFLVINNGKVDVLQVATADNTADRVVNMLPSIIDKVTELVKKPQAKKTPVEQIIPQ